MSVVVEAVMAVAATVDGVHVKVQMGTFGVIQANDCSTAWNISYTNSSIPHISISIFAQALLLQCNLVGYGFWVGNVGCLGWFCLPKVTTIAFKRNWNSYLILSVVCMSEADSGHVIDTYFMEYAAFRANPFCWSEHFVGNCDYSLFGKKRVRWQSDFN